jgi:hypothetical protein
MEDSTAQEALDCARDGRAQRAVSPLEQDLVTALELLPVVLQAPVERTVLGMPGTINAERRFHIQL